MLPEEAMKLVEKDGPRFELPPSPRAKKSKMVAGLSVDEIETRLRAAFSA